MSEILVNEIDVKFACLMVQTLNTILLTSTELFELRNQLKDLASTVIIYIVNTFFHINIITSPWGIGTKPLKRDL